jgi:hypothetical protein
MHPNTKYFYIFPFSILDFDLNIKGKSKLFITGKTGDFPATINLSF